MRIFSLLSLFLSICFSPLANANVLSISEQEINQYLATKAHEKMKLTDQVGIPGLFQLQYSLSNLSTQIGQTAEKRLQVSGMLDSVLQVKLKRYDIRLQLDMDTVPYYDAEKGALFLHDVRLVRWSATPEKYQNELSAFLPLMVEGISNILNHTPVYTLDENKTKEALVKKFGKAIVVEKGSLRLETSLF